ncbi:hypothetical protein RRG08_022095 [Elysia crispata]|uniref:Uncharacterized protein n=1 Tax=Elysia crispata TaxID=231223 RepID=A0AAE0Y1K6_9GAST|nr:hypothetical protein RRG08_022095 [Elysia crispata]
MSDCFPLVSIMAGHALHNRPNTPAAGQWPVSVLSGHPTQLEVDTRSRDNHLAMLVAPGTKCNQQQQPTLLREGLRNIIHQNIRRLLQSLMVNRPRCQLEFPFAHLYVDYVSHLLSKVCAAKGSKIDVLSQLLTPNSFSSLRPFLGQVQFYSDFLRHQSTSLER